jgi:3-oxoacyl-[acyl-carrier protein] reductase
MTDVPPYVPGHGLLTGKVVVAVTAAAGTGIGFATAKCAVEEVATVVVSDWHERRLGEAAEQLSSINGSVGGIVCDVTSQDQVDNLIDSVVETHGRIDVLVNNAGLGGTVTWST